MTRDSYQGPFGLVPTAAILDRRLSAVTLRVLAAMATYADRNRRCYYRQTPMAEDLGISQSRLSRHISRLVELGYVARERTGFPARNTYRILLDQPAIPERKHADTPVMPPERITGSNRARTPVMPPERIAVMRTDSITVPIHQTDSDRHISASARAGGSSDSYADAKLSPLWQTFLGFLNAPESPSEEGKWARAIRELELIGATPEEVRARAQRYRHIWPRIMLTPNGLAGAWGLLSTSGASHDSDPTDRRLSQQRRADEAARVERFKQRSRELIESLDEESPPDAARMPS